MENSYNIYKMTKTVTHIDVPKEWESTNDWDSHRPLLWLVVDKLNTNFAVECGCGYGSTLLLNKHCKNFVSYETNHEWFDKLTGEVPTLYWIDDWDSMATQECDLLFVDCAPGEIRKDIIKEHSNDAKVIVVHDSESTANYVYGMSEVLNSFKYRLDYQPEGKPHSSCVSNFIDVTQWI